MRKLFTSVVAMTTANAKLVRIALTASVVSILALALSAVPVSADALKPFIALLNSGQETPPNSSPEFGVAFLTFNEQAKELCFSISFTGLSTPERAAHFHGPAAPGVAAPVLIDLPPGNPKNGCVELTKEQTQFLKKGLLYINIHSEPPDGFPGGEIRGQVLPSKGVSYQVDEES